MAIVKMNLVRIASDKQHVDEMLEIATSKVFHAEEAMDFVQYDSDEKVVEFKNPYAEYAISLKNIAHSIGFNLGLEQNNSKEYTQEECENVVANIEKRFSFVSEGNVALTKDDEIALDALRELDYKKMHECQYVYFGMGRLPQNNAKKINLVDHSKLIYMTLHENNHYKWICYATSNTYLKEVQKSLSALYVEDIKIPQLDSKRIIGECGDEIKNVYHFCERKSQLVEMYRYLSKKDEQYSMVGFVPQKQMSEFESSFDSKTYQVEILPFEEYPDLKPPTLLKNSWFFRPFEMFVNMYSLPTYGELDPTMIVGLTYCFLFGLMFGDLGQGLLLFLGGVILEAKTKNKLAGIIGRVGIFAMFFGFIFGSVFGNEEILIPVHQALFNTPDKLIHVMDASVTMNLLLGAVAIGAFLILMSIGLNIFINVKRKHWGEVFFSHNGVAGFIFYSYVALAAGLMLTGSSINLLQPILLVIFVLVPVVLFFMKEPLTQLLEGNGLTPHAGWGNFILEAVFEVIEILLSFVTNSLSYLRVGGFIFSHAGMMLVVMTLVEMTGSAGPMVFILGNVFVMALEGLIVGIQTLRLEYYEMFSRYFEGSGRKFELISTENK
ncbi:MAG: V-type ATP synthase subunit I [Anaerorhabdus sp.]